MAAPELKRSFRTQPTHAASLKGVVPIDLATYREQARGNLTVVESNKDIPFSIARVFYLYGAPIDSKRGAHAHREAEQVFIAISGRCSLELSDGQRTDRYVMREPDRAVYVPPMIWARLYDFSQDAVCLVLCSSLYDPADYIRDWNEYVSAVARLSP
jgi:uncharacterized RmlC-like cupin family protein